MTEKKIRKKIRDVIFNRYIRDFDENGTNDYKDLEDVEKSFKEYGYKVIVSKLKDKKIVICLRDTDILIYRSELR